MNCCQCDENYTVLKKVAVILLEKKTQHAYIFAAETVYKYYVNGYIRVFCPIFYLSSKVLNLGSLLLNKK